MKTAPSTDTRAVRLSILLGYDIAIQALNYHLALIGSMNHTVLAFILSDVLAYAAAI